MWCLQWVLKARFSLLLQLPLHFLSEIVPTKKDVEDGLGTAPFPSPLPSLIRYSVPLTSLLPSGVKFQCQVRFPNTIRCQGSNRLRTLYQFRFLAPTDREKVTEDFRERWHSESYSEPTPHSSLKAFTRRSEEASYPSSEQD